MAHVQLQLTHRVTSTPAAPGSGFYVEAGREFDLGDFASAHGVDVSAFSVDQVAATHTAARNLKQGEWLFVTHETTGTG